MQIDGRLVASSLLKDFADDFAADGFGSYRRQLEELGSLEVSVRGRGDLGIYGPLHRLVSYYEDNSYRCGIEHRTSEEIEIASVFYCEAQHKSNNDDQWRFRLRVANEKEIELQKVFGTLFKSDLTPQQIQELADSMFKQ